MGDASTAARPGLDPDEVAVIAFDVFGTVVDWHGGIAAEAERALPGIDGGAFALAWRAGYQPAMRAVMAAIEAGEGGFVRLDDLHLRILDGVLRDFGVAARLDDAARRDLNRAWHRLPAWPDAVAGLARLRRRYTICPLSNGNIGLLTAMAKRADLPWDCVLSAEVFQAYKPDPRTYLGVASVFDVAQRLPHAAGRLVARELEVLTRLTTDPERPYVVVLGGSKVSDKLAVIEALLPKVDRLLVGGGMCFTFLAAQGHGVGGSLLEADQVETCRRLLAAAGDRIVLPVDVVAATAFSADAETSVVPVEEIPDGLMGLDVGPRTVEVFGTELGAAHTVFWNGPMGVFELAPFQAGTRGVAQAVAAVDGLSVVGGGDSAAAVRQLGLDEASYGHISTGGGASLEYLEGRELPGLAVLTERGEA